MIPTEIIEKAKHGGYAVDLYWFSQLPEYAHAQFLIDPLFWKALGKSLGWCKGEEAPSGHCSDCRRMYCDTSWTHYWHRLLDFLAARKTPEEYFKSLT